MRVEDKSSSASGTKRKSEEKEAESRVVGREEESSGGADSSRIERDENVEKQYTHQRRIISRSGLETL